MPLWGALPCTDPQVLAMNTPNHFKSKREHNLWHCFLGTL